MKLFGSFSFRLTLLYVVAFSLSVALLMALYYFVNVRLPIDGIKAQTRAETETLTQLHQSAGPQALAQALERRADMPAARKPYHVLLAADGTVLTTNLPGWRPPGPSPWLLIEADIYHDGEESDQMALVYDRRLPDGARLLLGCDIEDLRQRHMLVIDATRWLIVGALLFGVLGGILMSRSIGNRIESVNRTARRVMTGDFFERIPTYGRSDDFDRLAETLNLMLDRIQKLLESIRRVSDNVAHELRTPLARLHADLSELRTLATPESQPLIDNAVAEAEKLVELFDAVLRIGRIESNRDAIQMTDVDLSALLLVVIEIFGPSAEERQIVLAHDIAPGLLLVGNRNLIFQAVGNLMDNAIKYAPHGGRVHLVADRGPEGISISITDDGRGIPANQRRNVLERFVRLPETAGIHGLGLGLSFVKVTADVHDSTLEFADAHPGLRVIWRFPAPFPTLANGPVNAGGKMSGRSDPASAA